jgi:cobalt-zinc-cadmium efflux system membrane fusion protein
MKNTLYFIFLCHFACQKPKTPDPVTSNQQDAPHQHQELPHVVQVSDETVQKAGIRSVKAEKESLPTTWDANGETATDPDRQAIVSAQVPGRISAVYFKEGQKVKKGMVLVVIESEKLAYARAQYTSSIAKLQTARMYVERQKHLLEKGLTTSQETDTATADALVKEAEAKAASEVLSAFGVSAVNTAHNAAALSLKAPMDGYITHRNAVLGQQVQSETVLAEIARFDELFFKARVFEKDLNAINAAEKAEIRMHAYPQEVFLGSVETIGKQMETSTRSVNVLIKIKNPQGVLKSGMFGTARLVLQSPPSTPPHVVVPNTSIVFITEKPVVFVQTQPHTFDMHNVVLGRSASGKTEILTGLQADEKVVFEGVYTLKSLVLKSTFGEDE